VLVLTLRTDNPEAEIGLYDDATKCAHHTWQAHRELSSTIHTRIKNLLESQGKTSADIQGIVCFQGPGSFTGLRIGITVADTLAYGLAIPIVGAKGKGWIAEGIKRLQAGDDDRIVLPHYGAPVHTTTPRA
jgi:tRNA threonylcarbamoyladenosine biosynthesis protein TsaB